MDTNSAQTKTITQDQIINPWNVNGAVVDGKQQAIDYDKLIEQFGTKRIDKDLLERFETLTGKKCHIFLRRGVFFSHRELGMILDRYEKKKPFFLYTGRGPSSTSMHLGHRSTISIIMIINHSIHSIANITNTQISMS
ncbi:15000_t:CDS:2 [Entrophospora sp. SA101]|nr:15000_t:CDS:2 [Entrophospora sp. SA101]